MEQPEGQAGRLVVVSEATGKQGKSVVKALLEDNKVRSSQGQSALWKIRALTHRSSDSQHVLEELRKLGEEVELFSADPSNEEVKNALDKAYAFFSMTSSWEPTTAGKELAVGKMHVDVASQTDALKHLVLISAPNVEKLSHGKWKVPFLTDKALVEEYARKKFQGGYTTFLAPAFFYQNFRKFFAPRREQDGTLVFELPLSRETYLTGVDIEDIGRAVVTVLNNPSEWNEKHVPLFGENAHPQDYIQTFEEVTGKKAKYVPLTQEKFLSEAHHKEEEDEGMRRKKPVADELAQMFGYLEEFGSFGPYFAEGGALAKKANPELKTWRQWLEANAAHHGLE
ncbi:NmrA-like domain-containing protein 1 [Balamuthia mandrillaris]